MASQATLAAPGKGLSSRDPTLRSAQVHANAYPGYDQLHVPEGATEVACWAHTRHEFLHAELNESNLAKEAIGRIRELHSVERIAKARGLDDEACHALRHEGSLPIAGELCAWMAATRRRCCPRAG